MKVLASRCVGYNHMNCDYARSLGFRLCNGAYAPNGVAEYTVMAILMCIRKFKKALYNTNDNDFTLKGKMGRELRTMTVALMGTGKIGLPSSSASAASAAVSGQRCVRERRRPCVRRVCGSGYPVPRVRHHHHPHPPAAGDHRDDQPRGQCEDEGRRGADRQRPRRADGHRCRHRGGGDREIGALFMDAFPGETGIIHVPHNDDTTRPPVCPTSS